MIPVDGIQLAFWIVGLREKPYTTYGLVVIKQLWQACKWQSPVLRGGQFFSWLQVLDCNPSTRTIFRWLRWNHALLKCYIGVVCNHYFVVISHIIPFLYHQSIPSMWPMVTINPSCVSAAAWVLNNINAPIPQHPTLIMVPQCTEWHHCNLLASSTSSCMETC